VGMCFFTSPENVGVCAFSFACAVDKNGRADELARAQADCAPLLRFVLVVNNTVNLLDHYSFLFLPFFLIPFV
jgi:hypothetical protein